MQEQIQSTGIVILGMHRSGTSACAGLLRLHGAYLGEVIDSQSDNPTGFWENKDALLLNEELLRFLQCRWDWPWVFPEEWLDRIPDELSHRRDALITELCANPFWVIKDPRICLLWPWWQMGFTQKDCQIKILFCLRHPMQVAQSLAKRNQMETGQALLLWARHVLWAEWHSRGMRRVTIFYDDLLSAPAPTIRTIQDSLGIIFPVSPERDVAVDFISGQLRHHRDNQCPDTEIGCFCQEIFTLCRAEDALSQPGKWDGLRMRFASLLQEDKANRLQWALSEILLLNASRSDLHQQVVNQTADYQQLTADYQQLTADYQQLTAEYQRLFDQSTDAIYQREQTVNKKQARLVLLAGQIYGLNFQITRIGAERDQIVDDYKRQLSQLTSKYDQMLASRSWRLTAPLRSFTEDLRGIKRTISHSAPSKPQTDSPENSQQKIEYIRQELVKTPLFDAQWYLAHYPDVAQAGVDPLLHYIEYGATEGRKPNPYFDTAWYRKTYPDVAAAGVNPLLHYIKYGAAEGRKPSQAFDTWYYLGRNPDIRKSGMNPLHHFLITDPQERQIPHPPGNTTALSIRRGKSNPHRVLVADYRIPRPDISAGELSTVGILHDLCALGFEVVFIPANFRPDSHYEHLLRHPGLSFITAASDYVSIDDYLAQEGHTFSLFYFFRIYVAELMLELARRASPQARIIFHTVDLHYLRETREAQLEKDPVKAAQARITEEREMQVFQQSDLVIVLSPVEQNIIQEQLPQKKIVCFPVLYAPISTKSAGYEKRKDMFFLGGYAHPPNVDAVVWFATEIWPLIHEKLPNAIFHIIGAEAPEQVRRLGELPGIHYVGYVENLEEALATMRVSVVPLRYGAGIKGKVATAMGLGIPCVCTASAAEGMYLQNGEQALLADTPEDFASAVIQLYTNESLWRVISEKGRQHIAQHFGKQANTRQLLSVLQQAQALPLDLYINFCKNIDAKTLHVPIPSDLPEVSIIIPVYNQWHFTKDCLHSILTFCDANLIPYEILLADDGSTDETVQAAEKYSGIRVIRTEKNCGFLRNCNNAAKHARGKYIFLLNNDSIVLPGWLEALYKTMVEDDNIAVAGSKMLYPDGTIQEAGSVIFNDASGWNIGRRHQRYEAPFQVMRRVDYVSGCSMLIKFSVWEKIGGFDERYKNAYYEDSDFCFSARELGYSVVYQPESEMIHFENISYGPEAECNKTMLMQENCRIFLEKWRSVLQSEHLPPTPDWQMAMNHADMRQRIHMAKFSAFKDYSLHAATHQEFYGVIEKFECDLIPAKCDAFTFNGLCYVCKSRVDFQVHGAPTPNWRESLLCPKCHLNNRMRAFFHIFTQELQPDAKAAIYITEQTTPLYKILKQSFSHIEASEYLGSSVELGEHDNKGIRNEDLTCLSFADDTFDYILSLDVFEHIANYPKALSECCRCLKPGGTLLFTVPFVKSSEKNITRATMGTGGEIAHILPPEYHGDPLSSDGCLCFYHFGWEILDDLRNVGFQDAQVLFYWSKEFAYLGGEQLILSATKTGMVQDAGYKEKLDQEIEQFKQMKNVHNLPAIYHYWSHKYFLPMMQEFGFSGIDQFFADNLYQSAIATKVDNPRFISIGSGNCDLEIRVSKLLREKGLYQFQMECLELNPYMLARGEELAKNEGLIGNLIFKQGDFNCWKPDAVYAGVMANHALHHVVNLEGLFDAIKKSLHQEGKFVVSDMIGRNGHQRWPEALDLVHQFWQQMPDAYRYNQILKRLEPLYENWDCSAEGFEGIRAQDIMPLLIERFDFELFIGFANVISPFIDRCFGHNFDENSEWDRAFIDKIHMVDEDGFQTGKLKPTQMLAVMTPGSSLSHRYSRGISPEMALRLPT